MKSHTTIGWAVLALAAAGSSTGCFWRQNELLREELYQTRGEMAAVRRERDELKGELANIQMRYNRLNEELKEAQAGKRTLNDQCQEQIAELNEEKKALEENLGAEINRLKQRIAELEQGGARHDEEKLALAKRLQETEYLRDKLAKDNEELTAKFNEAENQRALLERKLQDAADETRKVNDTVSRLQKSLEERESKIESMNRQIETLEESNKDLQKKIKDQTDALFETIAAAAAAEFSADVKSGLMAVAADPDTGVRLILYHSALFEPGTVMLNVNSQPLLRRIGAFLQRYPERRIEVQGHTDNTPVANLPYPDNWSVASARAEKVARELIQAGVAPERLRVVSCSQFQPLEPNTTAEGRAKNRRVEIVFLPQPGH
ncbi:MAG: hypothetical protein Kow0059_14680 [Candidatus Sumerlaeia bacterium]